MAGRVRPDVRYQFYSRAGILPKYRYDTYLFPAAPRASAVSAYLARLSANNAISCDTDVVVVVRNSVSRSCGTRSSAQAHFFERVRAQVARNDYCRKPRSTEFGPSSPSVRPSVRPLVRPGLPRRGVVLCIGPTLRSIPPPSSPPNGRPDLRIVSLGVLRAELRDPSIEHPTGCDPQQSAAECRGTVYPSRDGMINGRRPGVTLLPLSGPAIRAACFLLSQPGQPTAVSTRRKCSYNGCLHKLGTPFLRSTLIFGFCALPVDYLDWAMLASDNVARTLLSRDPSPRF
ncbi:hypothetical protein X777_16125 [Ooceraea biroi]|uniref:Uncharacterized protein n=1 Tax=Ooceraea biroi TaxID=2015173 RepID=A0A026WV77_OOCBI|nr:hypothetical protein X777_16125 [Ooceraea biroi]